MIIKNDCANFESVNDIFTFQRKPNRTKQKRLGFFVSDSLHRNYTY